MPMRKELLLMRKELLNCRLHALHFCSTQESQHIENGTWTLTLSANAAWGAEYRL
jgi:hypothetical protein